ncbi:MAG: O-antigen ligase family protein [Bacteroidota bacterium]
MTGVLPIPILVSLLGLVTVSVTAAIRPTLRGPRLTVDDAALWLLLVVVGLSTLVNGGNSDMRWSHALAYLAVILLYYYSPVLMLWTNVKHRQRIDSFIVYGVFLAAAFALLEFTLKNFVGFPLDSYVPRPLVQIGDPTFMGRWIRARSFAEEPGHFALYLNTMAPLALLRAWQHYGPRTARWLASLVLLAFVTTFSSAGVVSAAVGAVAAGLLDRRLRRVLVLAGAVLGGLLLLWSLLGSHPAAVLSEMISGKLSLDNVSLSDRVAKWVRAWMLWQSHPAFGAGPGSAQGAISWYLELGAETGVIGTVMLLALLMLQVRQAMRLDSPLRGVMLYSLFASYAHYAVISNFWYPWLWFLFAYMRAVKLDCGLPEHPRISEGLMGLAETIHIDDHPHRHRGSLSA